jgi:hypothetical protein
MNLLTLGSDMARSMGVNVKATTALLLIVTSLMVSATVSYCGLVGFVGLVMPHMLRLMLGARSSCAHAGLHPGRRPPSWWCATCWPAPCPPRAKSRWGSSRP